MQEAEAVGGRGGRGALGGHGIPAAPRMQALGGGAWPHNATARTSLQLPRGPRLWREGRVAAPGPRGLTMGRARGGHPTARGTARWARVGWEGGVPAGTQGHRQEGLLVPGCHLAQTGGELPGTSTSLRWGPRTSGLAALPAPQDKRPAHPSRDQLSGGATVLAGAAGRQGGGPWMPGHRLGRCGPAGQGR